MRITALVENSRLEGREDLTAEHGLSLHIRCGDQQILFDTGASDAFGRNARQLGVDIEQVDLAVVSHHHFDHGGGLAHFLEANQTAPVYLRQCEDREFYFQALFFCRYVGLDRSVLERHADRFRFVAETTEIAPGVTILTQITKPHPLPKGNRRLFVQKGRTRQRDPFEHELIMVVREEEGLVVFTGCSHSGILNMIDTVTGQFPGTRIKAVLGGFHLIGVPLLNTMAGSKKEVAAMAREVLRYPVDRLYTGHCTGKKAYRVLKEVLGEKLEVLGTGSSVSI